MKPIRLVPIGPTEPDLLGALSRRLGRAFGGACRVEGRELSPAPAFHPERQQYHSTVMLEALAREPIPGGTVLLGITPVDLYIPILKYVFGEAQLGGPCALVSFHRLRQEFYGLPPDGRLLADRLFKEAVHEVGHTFSLHHCPDYRCAMASSHSVEWIDLKEPDLCNGCRSACGLEIRGIFP